MLAVGWRSENNPMSALTLCLFCCALACRLGGLLSLLVISGIAAPDSYVGTRDSNSGPYTCALPAGPSLQNQVPDLISEDTKG